MTDAQRPAPSESARASELRREVASLPNEVRSRLDRAGFDPDRLVALAAPLQRGAGVPAADGSRNRIRGQVEPPRPGEIVDTPGSGAPDTERLSRVGLEAIRRGELALCVMAGGMATRMGGVVKALVEAVDGHTFLEIRLNEHAKWTKAAGRPIAVWLMTSEATEGPIREALKQAGAPASVEVFTQDLALRLTPDGHLFRGNDGQPSTYAPGHGDLPDALRRSGLLSSFIERGGNYVWIANLDNLGATIDPALLGRFIESDTALAVEVTAKAEGDRGGIPVWADAEDVEGKVSRRLQILEEFRLPLGFDAASVQVFNTNTFLVRASALQSVRVRWNWFQVEKTVDGRTAIQFERLLQELTAAIPASYVRVPREGEGARFLPVKDRAELAKRLTDIRAVAKTRGLV
jgi:UTP--glucose-1-phosphate uridylyltransferase